MTTSAGSLKSSRQPPRGKSLGWAAFDLKQRHKQCVEHELNNDPYPPVSNVISPSSKIVGSQFHQMKPFSSVVRPALNFQPVLSTSQRGSTCESTSKKHDDQTILAINTISPLERLKKVHDWADNDLIQDILAAADNDEQQASDVLVAMASSGSNEENGISGVNSDQLSDNLALNMGETSLIPNRLLEKSNGKVTVENSSSVPLEPEWEEDDIYLINRKEAIRMARAASLHSRAANNAFLRGDHFSAHQHSVKAQDVWTAAKELNAKAAKKILFIQNIGNDIWKLDLHGLHASEAVSALEEHLHKIETEIRANCSGSCDETAKLAEVVRRTSLTELVGASELDSRAQKEQPMPLQRQRVLHVITGTGNHSHGEAALPTAIKSFLIENGYRFDDMRPGVFLVRPKFRRS